MADQSTAAAPTREQPTSRAPTRGRTTLTDRALERLARRYALEVPGVEAPSPGPEVISALISSLPKASVEQAGDRVRLEVQIAVAWHAHARSVATQVRSDVARRLAESTGRTVDRVDVSVTNLVRPGALDRAAGRRRVE